MIWALLRPKTEGWCMMMIHGNASVQQHSMAFGKGAFGRFGPDETASARYCIDMCISSRQRLIQEYLCIYEQLTGLMALREFPR